MKSNNHNKKIESSIQRQKLCVVFIVAAVLGGLVLSGVDASQAQATDPSTLLEPDRGRGELPPYESASPDWYQTLPPSQPGFPVALSGAYLVWGSSPTLADLDGNGTLETLVAGRDLAAGRPGCGGMVYAYRHNGTLFWQTRVRAAINSTPTVADLNGDGHPEIAFGAWDQCAYLLDRNGQPLWGNLPGLLPQEFCGGHGYYNEDTFWSSPALADVTGNGRLEIIIGADISPGNIWGDPGGGYLYIFDADGNALAREWMDQTIFSSPAAADLDHDGALEIVVGTGSYWAKTGYYTSAFDYDPNPSDPADRLILKWRRSTRGRTTASPAIADLNKDGWLDVIITSPVGENGADGTFLYVWRGSDGAPIIQRRICNFMGQSQNTLSSPTVADIDGDNRSEILVSHAWEVAIFNHDGTYYTDYSNPRWPGGPAHPGCRRDHQPTTELSYYARYSLYASPAIGDLDGDGNAEVVIPGHNPDNPNRGMIFAWTGHSLEQGAPWPTWRYDERHTGYPSYETIPPTNPTSLRSTSHTPGVRSTSNRVKVVWSGASDQGSGVAGYSVVWDTSPNTLPDTILDLGAATQSTTSPPLPNGRNLYFHLRTGDRAGNWTAGALHLGPFWIDVKRDHRALLPLVMRKH